MSQNYELVSFAATFDFWFHRTSLHVQLSIMPLIEKEILNINNALLCVDSPMLRRCVTKEREGDTCVPSTMAKKGYR